MLSMNIQNELLYFKDIHAEDLPNLLVWYNRLGDFKFATGMDMPITFQLLQQKYFEAAVCSNEFFVGIHNKRHEKMIGILKGRLQYEESNVIWISSIIIEPAYQGRGFGGLAMTMLLDYLKIRYRVQKAYLSVLENNVQGRGFWQKQGFCELKRIEKDIWMKGRSQNVLIMYKQI